MNGHVLPKARTIWLILMLLSLFSTFVAEGSGQASYPIIIIFVIAAVKSDLVIMHYMEAGRAASHWKLMYRAWLVLVTVLMLAGHLVTR